MNDNYLLAITILACLFFYVFMISTVITGSIYFVALYLFQFRIEKLSLYVIDLILAVITGAIVYYRISQEK